MSCCYVHLTESLGTLILYCPMQQRFLLVSTIAQLFLLDRNLVLFVLFPGPLGVQDGSACVYIANYCLFVRDGKTGPRRGVVLSGKPALGVTGSFQHQQALKGWAVRHRLGTVAGTSHVSQDSRGMAGQQLWPVFVGAFGVYYRESPGWVKNPITSNVSHGTFIAWKPRITTEVLRQAWLGISNGDSSRDGTWRWGNPQRAFVIERRQLPGLSDILVLLANAGQPPSALCTTLDSSWSQSYQPEIVTCFSSTVPPNATLARYSLMSCLLTW